MRVSATRPAALVGMVALAVAAVAAAVWLCHDAVGLLAARDDPADLLLAAAEVLTAGLIARCAVGGGLAVTAVVSRRPRSPRDCATARAAVLVTPALLRPVVCALLTLSVSTGVAAPALAASSEPPLPAASWSSGAASPSATSDSPGGVGLSALPAAGWVPPESASAGPPTSAHLVTGSPHRAGPPHDVVVQRGDSLWAIVARTLGPQANDARVAREWPRWYAANRARIGDDPNLLQPGMTLHVPAPVASR